MSLLLKTAYPKVQFYQPDGSFWDHAGSPQGPPGLPAAALHLGQVGLQEDFAATDCDRIHGTRGYWFLVRFNGPIRLWRGDAWADHPAGTAVLWAPGERHRYGVAAGAAIHHDYLFVRGRSVDALVRSLALPTDRPVAGLGQEPFSAHLHALIQELLRQSPNEAILEQIVRIVLLTAFNNAVLPGREDERVHFIRRRLDLDFASAHSLRSLARAVHLSPGHLHAVFSRSIGQPPIAYLIALRLRRACELLRSTNLAIKEIAAQVGYDDQYFFSRLFRSRHHVSPRAFRAQTH